MYFMLGLFGLFFWLTELPIFLEMVFSNSQWLQRCLLGSGQLITTNPTDSRLSYCFNSIALSYPKPHLLGKSHKCSLLRNMVLILSQLSEKSKTKQKDYKDYLVLKEETISRDRFTETRLPFAAAVYLIVCLLLKHFPLDAECNFCGYKRGCPFFICGLIFCSL